MRLIADINDRTPFFIYALCEPDGKTIRYIGATTNLWKRLGSHYNRASHGGVRKWMSELRSRGLVPCLIVLQEVIGSSAALRAEQDEIQKHYAILGDKLLNYHHTGNQVEKAEGPIDFGGKSQSLTEWAADLGITRQALHMRLRKYPPEIALTHGKGQIEEPGLAHEERRKRRQEMAIAIVGGQSRLDVARRFGVTTATVAAAIKQFTKGNRKPRTAKCQLPATSQ